MAHKINLDIYNPFFFKDLRLELRQAVSEEEKESIAARVTVIASEAFAHLGEVLQIPCQWDLSFDVAYDQFLALEETLPSETKKLSAFVKVQQILFSINSLLAEATPTKSPSVKRLPMERPGLHESLPSHSSEEEEEFKLKTLTEDDKRAVEEALRKVPEPYTPKK